MGTLLTGDAITFYFCANYYFENLRFKTYGETNILI